ncbi:MAG: asparagine synthetase B [candidate division KSB1 bacterium]|nr:asparagine synthetase B [candidate division KSB1 bacterium]MDZ7304400.1 asparagine synthetase B [candidate division KSB1 bacterium]MDZ7313350.1 asparagine synthetase B [candidate division KSB1 bacterium]
MRFCNLSWLIIAVISLCTPAAWSQKLLIYMDLKQTDHLKAYGVAYWALDHGVNVEWLLNYRGGSFMMDYQPQIERECRVRGVAFANVGGGEVTQIYADIEAGNMEVVLLEKAPAIAIYTPPNKQVWDDAVTLALSYAEIPYTTLWDEEVLRGELEKYDWLHLHHEDFTGQYGRFYASFSGTPWYQEEVAKNEEMAKRLGFSKVSELKKAVARAIKEYVLRGGFLFAMCSATDTIDLALAAANTDICAAIFDYDPPSPNAQNELDYSQTFAFENFTLEMNPLVYEFSDIDIPPSNSPRLRNAEADFFTLFEFSAKYDPVPTMLTQDHVSVVKGFMGQTTGFKRSLIKKSVTILAEVPNTEEVKYIHGNLGRGTFTFYGGHDPEDYQHLVYDPPTQLSLHKNSPGYRLILNNILFPAAKKKKRKT